jgi:hypothetical protein
MNELEELAAIHVAYTKAKEAQDLLASERRAAVIKAVNAGHSKAAVARIIGVTAARVAAICNPESKVKW